MHHDAIEKHVNKRLEYSSATIFLIPNGHKIVQKSVQMNLLLRGDVTKRKKGTTGPEAGFKHNFSFFTFTQTRKYPFVSKQNHFHCLDNRGLLL